MASLCFAFLEESKFGVCGIELLLIYKINNLLPLNES